MSPDHNDTSSQSAYLFYFPQKSCQHPKWCLLLSNWEGCLPQHECLGELIESSLLTLFLRKFLQRQTPRSLELIFWTLVATAFVRIYTLGLYGFATSAMATYGWLPSGGGCKVHVVVLLVLQSFTHQIANRQNHTSFREIAVFVMGSLFEGTFESIRLHTMLHCKLCRIFYRLPQGKAG